MIHKFYFIIEKKKSLAGQDRHFSLLNFKLPGRDGSWMGDYATCGSCHPAHAAWFALAPRLLQRYDRWVSRTNYASLLVYNIQALRSLSSRCSNFKHLRDSVQTLKASLKNLPLL